MNFLNAIEEIMKADSLLYNSNNASVIRSLACNRGFFTEKCENNIGKSINNLGIDYSISKEGLISLNQKVLDAKIEMFNLEGKLIFSDIFTGIDFQLPNLSKGLYILKVNQFSGKITFQ